MDFPEHEFEHIANLCVDEAKVFSNLCVNMQVLHIFCFFVTLYRELYDTNMSVFG